MAGRFTLKLNRTTLFESTKIKYLGIILDNSLSWKHHIFELRKKLSRAVGILYKMRSLNTPKNVLLSLYYSLFHSHMSYGICLYGSADDQYLSKIVLIKKRAIRLISKAPFNAHTTPLFKNLGVLNFSNTLKLQLSMLMWQYESYRSHPRQLSGYSFLSKKILGGPFFFRCFLCRGMSEASEKPWFEEFYW